MESQPATEQKKMISNIGGASKVTWFNVLATHEQLQEARSNLFHKINRCTVQANGCKTVDGVPEDFRPGLDSSFISPFKDICPDGPAKFSSYQIALLQAKVLVPLFDPPSYLHELRTSGKSLTILTSLRRGWLPTGAIIAAVSMWIIWSGSLRGSIVSATIARGEMLVSTAQVLVSKHTGKQKRWWIGPSI